MKSFARIYTLAALGSILAATMISCTDTQTTIVERVDTVEVGRELFAPPPADAGNFLGYFEIDDGLTTCGNCHVGVQADWENTAHSDAWAGLQDSGHARDFCEGCHTVSELGNPATETAGYSHGPGLDHVENPDASQPLANLAVGLDLTFGCGECHQGNHHGFTDDWLDSKHAAPWGEFFPGGVDAGAAAAVRPECQSCHLGQGALKAWGVEDSYIEADASVSDPEGRLPITCGVCHDPHGTDNEAQLRFPINVASAEEHLCARCHNRRTTPNPESSHGLEPHAPETGLLQGDVGWFPPNVQIDRGEIIATHGSDANPGLCATCHVSSFEVSDEETGEFVFNATGHNFTPAPCLDEQGIPTAEDCELSQEARSFEGCTASGCHGTEQAAFSALVTASTRIQDLAEELHDLLEQVDPNLTDEGGEIDPTEPTFTVAEGAFFNYALAEFPGTERIDSRMVFAGSASHNPFLMEQLLIASIDAVEEEYGVQASPALVRARTLGAGQ